MRCFSPPDRMSFQSRTSSNLCLLVKSLISNRHNLKVKIPLPGCHVFQRDHSQDLCELLLGDVLVDHVLSRVRVDNLIPQTTDGQVRPLWDVEHHVLAFNGAGQRQFARVDRPQTAEDAEQA